MPGDWAFDVDETSANAYRVTARDLSGRRLERTGTDPDVVLEQCKQDAAALDRPATTWRYFRRDVRAEESAPGAGTFWIEFGGDQPVRQVERYGGRWFSSRHDHHPGLGPGLVDQPLSEFELDPQDEISAEEFESAWEEAK